MANRQFTQFQNSLEKGIVRLYCRVSVGAGGAVTLQKWNPATRTYSSAATSGTGAYAIGSQGVKTVVRSGTGAWTITLQDTYQRLLGVQFSSTATSGTITVNGIGIDATSDVTAATPTVKIVLNAATTPTDPASGDKIDLEIVLQNSATV